MRLTDAETAEIIERTDGVTASFLKELLRRAVLEALADNDTELTVTATDVARALDDLLDTTQHVTRSLLGVGNDPTTLPAGGGAGTVPPPQMGRAWMIAQARSRAFRPRH